MRNNEECRRQSSNRKRALFFSGHDGVQHAAVTPYLPFASAIARVWFWPKPSLCKSASPAFLYQVPVLLHQLPCCSRCRASLYMTYTFLRRTRAFLTPVAVSVIYQWWLAQVCGKTPPLSCLRNPRRSLEDWAWLFRALCVSYSRASCCSRGDATAAEFGNSEEITSCCRCIKRRTTNLTTSMQKHFWFCGLFFTLLHVYELWKPFLISIRRCFAY